ncbi:MAG: divalent-cation tolerance protein CutA, partial [Candidatus Aenigmarchaeota archaeon]|nr:divalent-cation tolerance protein CutA [Candidatus Aenigmarchaeota archaeon]
MTFNILFVTCPNNKSADKISEVLLNKKLVACVKLSSVKSKYWWKGKIEKHPEVLMTILTKTNLCKQIEKLIKKMHPYD